MGQRFFAAKIKNIEAVFAYEIEVNSINTCIFKAFFFARPLVWPEVIFNPIENNVKDG
jgi:hypothetical protein